MTHYWRNVHRAYSVKFIFNFVCQSIVLLRRYIHFTTFYGAWKYLN